MRSARLYCANSPLSLGIKNCCIRRGRRRCPRPSEDSWCDLLWAGARCDTPRPVRCACGPVSPSVRRATPEGAFVETVLRRPANRIVRRAFVEERMWTPLRLHRQLVLAKLMDEGLLFHGVDASISAGADYAPSRALALALHEDYPDLDGLAYRSRHNNGEVCYALFDRVLSSDLVTLPGQRFEDDPARTDQLMRLHGAVFDTSLPIT
ncbi:RES family NAD+ phosphorylase [Sinorhizobium meliloti]|uniref:RES family NAD+ phosphorylase n=1 Tax=Rhizobium meliloti TaxID=382 RepID=UPI001F2AC48E|nr:RES family NAD+ phosphorylase [Sinorhizobium meliloti]